ncbi:protein bicaudal D homolog 2-like [Protopterus annectens]|uniref:protein bicaudal D homolog 2-like n=1 Tax=Protopterus annectens TaxID=7888 RepID=UPI001CF9872B|nr:protein bicaudal D homolog 2-like [Protopterus annectens]
MKSNLVSAVNEQFLWHLNFFIGGIVRTAMAYEENIPSLRVEVERLRAELQEANDEKVQAAQYGLAVLEENSAVKQRFAELEAEHETLKHELEQIKEALTECYSSHKKVTADGATRVEYVMREAASKEAKLKEKIEEMNTEMKQMKVVLTNSLSENEQLTTEVQELKKECELIENEKAQLREDLKQSKVREMRQLQDFAELEEENITLQKQVSSLKESQVEFEGVKHELKQRDEEIEILNGELEEIKRLRDLAEHQLEEALESLKSEKEQKNNIRKELSYYTSTYDSIGNLQGNLEELSPCEESVENLDETDSGYSHGGFGKLKGEIRMSTPRNSDIYHPGPSLVADLFSELSLSEIQKLKQQLMQVEREKTSLLNKVQELQRQLDSAMETVLSQQDKMNKLSEELQTVKLKDCKEVDFLEVTANEMQFLDSKYRSGSAEGVHLKNEGKEASITCTEHEVCQQEQRRWEREAKELLEKVNQCMRSSRSDQETIAKLEKELRAVKRAYTNSQGSLSMAQDHLVSLSEELATLYHHICMCNNLTPNLVMLDYYKEGRGFRGQLRKRKSSDLFGKLLFSSEHSVLENSSGDLSPLSCPSSPGSDYGDSNKEPMNISNLTAVIRDQIKHLQEAVELSRQCGMTPGRAVDMEQDKEALLEELMKLKSLLSTKKEQIATLRTVLKANKQTAEVALSNLKSKYDNEKALVTETMVKLRNELKALKEDAAAFSSLRAVFASRCDQYVSELEEMQRQLAAAEDEKRTLNSLLRMAIQQKLALTHRLESLESHPESPRTNRAKPSPNRTRTPKTSPR